MIELLITAMLLGLGSGAFALFLDSCMGERMIFRRYWLWLDRQGRRSKHLAYWFKPLGLCIYCFSEWCFIGIGILFVTKFSTPIQSMIVLFCVGSGFNYVIVDLWQKK